MANRYWVGGSASWDNIALLKWSLTSGGVGGAAVPTAGDDVYFDAASGAVTITLSGALTCLSFNSTGFTGTVAGTGTLAVSANAIYGGGATFTNTGAWTFNATSGTQQITTNSKTLTFPIIQDGVGGTVQLQDNLTMGSTRTYTLTNGILDLSNGNRTLSTGLFSSANSNTRSIAFGTGNITLTGNAGGVFAMTTATNFTYAGTPTINATYAGSTGTRTIQFGNTAGATETNAPSINISAGTDIISISTGSSFKSVNFSGFSGSLSNNGYTVYGDLTFSLTMSIAGGTTPTPTFAATSGVQKLKSNAFSLSFPLVVNCPGATVQLQDDCNVTNTGTTAFTLTAGSLDLGGFDLSVAGRFNSTTANVRSILFGVKQIKLTGNNITILNFTNYTNFTYTGTPIFNCTYPGGTGTRTISLTATGITESNAFDVYISAGTDIFTGSGTCNVRNFNFIGFAGTLSVFVRNIYKDLTISSGMTLSAGTNTTSFIGASTQKITTNGKTLDFPLNFNGIGNIVAFQDALTQGATRVFTVVNGTIQLKNGVTSTVGAFTTSGTNQKFLESTTLGSQATLTQSSGTVNASYLTIKDNMANGGATFNAFTDQSNVDAGNVNGWNFGVSPLIGSGEYNYALRSLTESRRF